jgi:hypothetical protein
VPGAPDYTVLYTASQIADRTLTAVKIALATLTGAEIADATLTRLKIALATLTDAEIAAANKDGAAAILSLRTLGAGAQQACAGNDARLSDARAPTAHAANHRAGGSDPVFYVGTYTGDGAASLAVQVAGGVRPRALFVASVNQAGWVIDPQDGNNESGGAAAADATADLIDSADLDITSTGFQAKGAADNAHGFNVNLRVYRYIAFL